MMKRILAALVVALSATSLFADEVSGPATYQGPTRFAFGAAVPAAFWGNAIMCKDADDNWGVLSINADGELLTSATCESTELAGNTASGAALTVDPVTIGGRAEATAPTAVDDGDVVDLFLTLEGAVVVAGHDGTNPKKIATDSSGFVKTVGQTGTNNIGDVDVEIMGAAATVGAGSTTVTADETLVAAAASTRLFTLTLVEDAAGTASGVIRHGVEAAGSCTGNIITAYSLEAGGTVHFTWMDRGVAVASGVCADVASGSVTAAWSSLVEAAP